jgi:hypothetical protein
MPVPVLNVDAETPLLLQGDTADKPRPAPNAIKRSASAAAPTAPAAMAPHDTADCASTIVDAARKSVSMFGLPGWYVNRTPNNPANAKKFQIATDAVFSAKKLARQELARREDPFSSIPFPPCRLLEFQLAWREGHNPWQGLVPFADLTPSPILSARARSSEARWCQSAASFAKVALRIDP